MNVYFLLFWNIYLSLTRTLHIFRSVIAFNFYNKEKCCHILMGYASKGHRKNVIFHILHWSHYKILLKICLKSPCNSFETKFNNQRVLEPLEISRSRAPSPLDRRDMYQEKHLCGVGVIYGFEWKRLDQFSAYWKFRWKKWLSFKWLSFGSICAEKCWKMDSITFFSKMAQRILLHL